jgi:DNA-binding MarR family transcriptional regulator
MTRKPLPSQFSGPADSPGFLLWKISNAWQRKLRSALQPLELTHSQFVVLAAATWFGASELLTQARLAEVCGMDPMTTSQVVRALEAAALLERREHPEDPRANAIAATAAGRHSARKAVAVVEAADAAFFGPIAADVPRLVTIFQRLAQA